MSSKRTDNRKPERIVRIYNLSEDVWPFIEAISDKKERSNEIDENVALADHDLFCEAEKTDITFISATGLSKEYLEYFMSLCNVKDVEVLVPRKHTGQLCEDILKDKELLKKLVGLKRKYKRVVLKSYSTTDSFLRLAEKLADSGLEVKTPAAPDANKSWTVNFYGSKSGIRQLTQINGAIRSDLKMPEGMICHGIVDTAKIAASKYVNEGGVVIKTNKGHAGMGVLIYRPGDLSKKILECEMEILSVLQLDEYWEKFPIVVESLVEPNLRIGGGFPNTEFCISKEGNVSLLFYGGMRVDKNGVFGGMEIAESSLPERVAARITDIGFLIGEQYAKDGYRGYFDIDFIAGKSGEVYVNESNVRATGGTHVFHTARQLIGDNFMKESFVLSNNSYKIKKTYTFKVIKNLLEPVLFNKKTKEGVVIVSDRLLEQKKFGYIVFGKNKKRAERIEQEMLGLMKI